MEHSGYAQELQRAHAQSRRHVHGAGRPTRRAILRRLTAGEATVTELARPFAMSQPAISKHLKVLERAGLVSRRRDAQRRPCRLEARRLKAATDWLDGYRRYWDESYQRLDALLDELTADGEAAAGRRRAERRADDAQPPANDRLGDRAALTARTIVLTPRLRRPAPTSVFAALTQPDLLVRWHGAQGWNLVECEVDLRPGGAWRFVSAGPGGETMGMSGAYLEVDAPGTAWSTPRRSTAGTRATPSSPPGSTSGTGAPRMTTTVRYPSQRLRDAMLATNMERGAGESYERLAAVLAGGVAPDHTDNRKAR